MKATSFATFVALLMVGCGLDIQVPKMIKCDACGKNVSSAGEFCTLCSHPVADSVAAYKGRIKKQRQEEERKRQEERQEEERKRQEEEREAKPFGGLKVLAEIRKAKVLGVTFLKLDGNQISDLSPLAGLTELKSLDLGYNQIFDISPLSDLTNLKTLDLHNNRISDISPLARLPNLEELYLNGNEISDVSPLKGLRDLEELWLDNNQITDDQKAMLRKALPDCDIEF